MQTKSNGHDLAPSHALLTPRPSPRKGKKKKTAVRKRRLGTSTIITGRRKPPACCGRALDLHGGEEEAVVPGVAAGVRGGCADRPPRHGCPSPRRRGEAAAVPGVITSCLVSLPADRPPADPWHQGINPIPPCS
jgi:hypothetical protein